MSQIPVICDRCRASGTGGEGDFAHLGDLLELAKIEAGRYDLVYVAPERLLGGADPRREGVAIGD